jgi:hypothetical protein
LLKGHIKGVIVFNNIKSAKDNENTKEFSLLRSINDIAIFGTLLKNIMTENVLVIFSDDILNEKIEELIKQNNYLEY